MTEKTEKVVFENPDGEVYDVYGAFDRHPALTGRNADTDISVDLNPSYEMEFTIRVGAGTMARLVQILNTAPVDGNPLNAIVNLENDSTASDRARERIARYLTDNGYEATLENVAAAFLYSGVDTPYSNITLPYGKYCISRISGIKQEANTTGASTFALTTITTPGGWNEKVNTTFDFPNADISYVEGEEYKNLGVRVLRYYEPGKNAALGGILMERTA